MRAFRFASIFLIAFLCTTIAFADSILTGSIPYTFTPGTVISSSQMNADFNYIINGVNTNAAKNGVNSSITALTGLTTPIDQNSGGSPVFNATTIGGTANAITVTATRPAISSFTYTIGNIVTIVPIASNTSATTINVNSLGIKNILKSSDAGPVALTGGELRLGNPCPLYYDGTQFIFINIPRLFGTFTGLTAASTTDLATVPSHLISINGATTITSFGSNASTNEPFYYLRFTSALSITYNSSTIITPNAEDLAISTNDTIIVVYLGSGLWNIISYIPAQKRYSVGTVNGLTINNNATTPTTQIDITTTGRSILENTSGEVISIGAQTLTINAATTGANGLDAGSLANNTWYYIYLIAQADGTVASLLSTSSTTPTMPAGYTYKYRIGVQRTGGAATFLQIQQAGNEAQYKVVAASTTPNLPIITSTATGSCTVPTRTSFSMANFMPPTAAIWRGGAREFSSSGCFNVAPNNSYGSINSPTNPPPCAGDSTGGFGSSCHWDFYPESANIFIAFGNTGAGAIYAIGWKDTVNAN